jgi:hypothetical protein
MNIGFRFCSGALMLQRLSHFCPALLQLMAGITRKNLYGQAWVFGARQQSSAAGHPHNPSPRQATPSRYACLRGDSGHSSITDRRYRKYARSLVPILPSTLMGLARRQKIGPLARCNTECGRLGRQTRAHTSIRRLSKAAAEVKLRYRSPSAGRGRMLYVPFARNSCSAGTPVGPTPDRKVRFSRCVGFFHRRCRARLLWKTLS